MSRPTVRVPQAEMVARQAQVVERRLSMLRDGLSWLCSDACPPCLPAGSNSWGQLGTGTTANARVPTAVSGGRAFMAITGGYSHSCAVDTSGSAWCWGKCARPASGGSMGAHLPPHSFPAQQFGTCTVPAC